MDYSTITPALESWFKRPLSKLPRKVRPIAEAYIPTWPDLTPRQREERAKEIDRQQGVKLRIKLERFRRQRKRERENSDPMEMQAGMHIGFYDEKFGSGHVRLWLEMGAVSTQDAALLLHGKNPSSYKGHDVGDAFNDMKKSFDDVARDGRDRSLKEWVSVARRRNLNGVAIAGWEACIAVSARDTSEQSEAMHPTAPVMNAPENRYWRAFASEILATELKIEKWATKDRSIPSEALIWESTRAALDDRLSKLEELWKLPPFLVKDWKALTDDDLETAIRNAAQADVKSQGEPVVAEGAPDGVKADSIVANTAPAQNPAPPAPVEAGEMPDTVERSQVKRRTWRDVAWCYVVETFKADQYSTAKALYRALESKAGAEGSPFDKGTGQNLHSLYVREISETVVLKTIQNAWTEIKASR